jgi:hypothetical protein
VEVFAFAESYAASRGYLLGPGARGMLFDHARDAAIEIEASPLSQQPDKIETAKLNFQKLIDQMIVESWIITSYKQTNPGMIGEYTLGKALAALCPLWPFCK